MINIRPLIEQRIRGQVPSCKNVSGVASLASIQANLLSDMGCYVFQERITANPPGSIDRLWQSITLHMAVITVVRNVRSANGVDAADVGHDLQDAVRGALLGWKPAVGVESLEYVSGALVSFSNGFFIWKDTYKTTQIALANEEPETGVNLIRVTTLDGYDRIETQKQPDGSITVEDYPL